MYGGTFENRLRLCLNIISKTRQKVGPEYPLYCRMLTQEFVDGGLSIEDTKMIAREFEKVGLDAIDLNNGIRESVIHTIPPACLPRGFASDLAMEIKKSVSIPVIIAGRINDPYLAEEILENGKADFIAFGRPLIADPDLPGKITGGRPEDVRKCIACNIGCRGRLMPGLHVRCTVNPVARRELEYKEYFPPLADGKKKIVIVGGGPAGMEAAHTAAARGHDVVLIERSGSPGGDQIAAFMVPPHKQELAFIPQYYHRQFAKYDNLRLITGTEAVYETIADHQPDAVIIATGSVAIIPDIPGSGNAVIAREVLGGGVETGHTAIVVGGNAIGCETAEWLAAKNKKVILVEMQDEIGLDMEPATRHALLKRLAGLGVQTVTGKKTVEVTGNGVVCVDKQWRKSVITGDKVIFAVGSRPNDGLLSDLQGRIKELYVIGDARVPGKIIDAVSEAYRLARSI